MRVSVKAIIIRNNQLLTTRNRDAEGDFYLLPGGGQLPGEPLSDTLRRECREEISTDVEVHELVFVRDYIGQNHEFADKDRDVHQLELMFQCSLPPGATPLTGAVPDTWQVGISWLELPRLADYRVYPKALQTLLRVPLFGRPVYLGDVN
ncbi:MAG: NUDIX domain-containing protein [Chloroflexota bacterium]|nr:NUDIX domain-containing protein [Chloroflexota bacterium]